MVGQKQRIIKRFEREAKTKKEYIKKLGLNCICGKCDLALFNLEEIKTIILFKDLDEITLLSAKEKLE